MTTTAPTLFTLPPHLRANITALLGAEIAPTSLQDDLRAALAAADIDEMEESDAEPPGNGQGNDQGPEDEKPVVTPRRKPPTIEGEILDRVAAWASCAGDGLAAAKLDPADYSFIGLLAGTEVYLAPRQRALAAAADKALADKDKANPFLPIYMSPTLPSLGSEYRQMTRQVATVLNVLFSVFGVGGGVFYAARSVGWTREAAILLGILGGVVVGIADSALLWIFKVRLKKDRRDTAHRRVRMNKGSAAIPGSEKVLSLEAEKEDEPKTIDVMEEGQGEAASSTTARPSLRLRRKPLS